jgi:hypothetical protein
MKRSAFVITAIAVACLSACKDGTESTTTTDSTLNSSSTSATGSEMSSATSTSTINIRPDASYVDLKSGKQVKLRVDTTTNYVVNVETNEPIYYYIDPSTSDTFDRGGQNVSNALIRGSDGNYTVDESRLKMKMQSDGDIKTKDEAGNKTKVETDGKIKNKSADGTKEKLDGDKYKSKSDTGKTKSKQ